MHKTGTKTFANHEISEPTLFCGCCVQSNVMKLASQPNNPTNKKIPAMKATSHKRLSFPFCWFLCPNAFDFDSTLPQFRLCSLNIKNRMCLRLRGSKSYSEGT